MKGPPIAIAAVVLAFSSFALSFVSEQKDAPKKCQFIKHFKMLMADCYGLELEEVPTNLRTSVQILDLSHNRIRSIGEATFKRYTSIKFLYLGDNIISRIDSRAFTTLTDLEVLDLSKNPFPSVPTAVLHMPRLRKLYLDENEFPPEEFFGGGPLTAPLQYLGLSGMPSLRSVPALGTVPHLVSLNLSRNEITNMTTSHFAGLCDLQILDLTNTTVAFRDDECECVRLTNWLRKREVKFSLECPGDSSGCTKLDLQVPTDDLNTYTECLREIVLEEQRNVVRTLVIGALLALAVAGAIVTVVVLRRRKRRRRRHAEAARRALNEKQPDEVVRYVANNNHTRCELVATRE